MIHHLYILGVGLMYVGGFFLIPCLLGLPLEVLVSRDLKTSIDPIRAWGSGAIIIAALSFVYFVGTFFV